MITSRIARNAAVAAIVVVSCALAVAASLAAASLVPSVEFDGGYMTWAASDQGWVALAMTLPIVVVTLAGFGAAVRVAESR